MPYKYWVDMLLTEALPSLNVSILTHFFRKKNMQSITLLHRYDVCRYSLAFSFPSVLKWKKKRKKKQTVWTDLIMML